MKKNEADDSFHLRMWNISTTKSSRMSWFLTTVRGIISYDDHSSEIVIASQRLSTMANVHRNGMGSQTKEKRSRCAMHYGGHHTMRRTSLVSQPTSVWPKYINIAMGVTPRQLPLETFQQLVLISSNVYNSLSRKVQWCCCDVASAVNMSYVRSHMMLMLQLRRLGLRCYIRWGTVRNKGRNLPNLSLKS